ncbi:MAG: NCS2 family permease [Bacillota bacterium]|uniref:NCS2 family permease n=1 Tax=Desulfurispora thermophila TaxID=265470 RepID=UPI00037EE01E|nr:NCS2 family permease [Desulfurispora thermophila]
MFLNDFFQLQKRGTTVKTEVLAGITTFMTMAYILAVNPGILSTTGMDYQAVFFATCIASGIITMAMGLFVNFPIALAPGMGLNAYFAVVAAKGGDFTWQEALGAVFISGIIFTILTITNLRQLLMVAVPAPLKKAITAGIGLFITIIGVKLSELVVVDVHLGPSLEAIKSSGGFGHLLFFEWDLKLGNLSSPGVQMALFGLLLSSLLMARRVKGALLWGILATTALGIPLGVTKIENFAYKLPDISHLAVGQLNIPGALHHGLITVIFTFTFVELFDTFGTLMGTTSRAGLLDEHGNNPNIGKAMLVDALGVSFGAFMGTSSTTAYIESSAGIGEGGRTGLTAVVTGLLFIAALFLAPVFALIPSAATAPALIIVGMLMITDILEVNFQDITDGVPAFITMTMMPFTYNIANGISAGIVLYTVLKALTGKVRDVHWLMWILTVLVVLRYSYIGIA